MKKNIMKKNMIMRSMLLTIALAIAVQPMAAFGWGWPTWIKDGYAKIATVVTALKNEPKKTTVDAYKTTVTGLSNFCTTIKKETWEKRPTPTIVGGGIVAIVLGWFGWKWWENKKELEKKRLEQQRKEQEDQRLKIENKNENLENSNPIETVLDSDIPPAPENNMKIQEFDIKTDNLNNIVLKKVTKDSSSENSKQKNLAEELKKNLKTVDPEAEKRAEELSRKFQKKEDLKPVVLEEKNQKPPLEIEDPNIIPEIPKNRPAFIPVDMNNNKINIQDTKKKIEQKPQQNNNLQEELKRRLEENNQKKRLENEKKEKEENEKKKQLENEKKEKLERNCSIT